MLRTLMLCGMLATSLLAAAPLASATGCNDLPDAVRERVGCAINSDLIIHVTHDSYGARCTGAYVDQTDEAHQLFGVCAGKGVITPDPTDCVVYVYLYGGFKQCVAA